jgi:hypothetical protein
LVGGLIRTQTDAGDFVGNVIVSGGKIVAIVPGAKATAEKLGTYMTGAAA